MRRIARRAGITKRVGPHTLRHALITAALDAGVALRDVQEAASHADPRTTMRYDRARVSLDRHATYIVATFIAGAARKSTEGLAWVVVAHDEWRHKLRIAITHRDAAAITQLLHDEVPEEGLQHAGDAVLCALAVDPDVARDVGSSVADALRARFWDGDTELADAIDTALERRTDTLTPIAVDLDFLADALTEPLGSIGYLDLHTGAVITEASLDYTDEDDDIDVDDRSRWLPVPGEGSDEPYRDMRHFIATVTDARLTQQLDHAIEGRGAFGRFYDVIATKPAEHTRWQRYSDDARLGRARSWLAEHGHRPAQPTSSTNQDSK